MLGDRGNAVGSAGGSNYAGDGMGGQVNMNGVGMGGNSVLRRIAGRWTAVSRAQGAQIDAGGSVTNPVPQPLRSLPPAPTAVPVRPPVQRPVPTAPVASTSIPVQTLINQYSQYRSPPSATAQASPSVSPQEMVNQYSQYRSPPSAGIRARSTPPRSANVGVMDTPRATSDPTNGIGRNSGLPTGPAISAPSYRNPARSFPAREAAPDRSQNVGVMDTPRMSADPTNGIGRNLSPPAGQRVTDVYGPDYSQDPSISGRVESRPITSMAAEAARRAAANRLRDMPRASADPTNGLGRMSLQASRPAPSLASLEARARAVSRGPGSIAGVMPGASALSQQRTMQTLGGAMTEGGMPLSRSDVQNLARTVAGEAGAETPLGQTAVANTMLNRMALAASNPEQYKYMGGGSLERLMAQYDATGPTRAGGVPNRAFRDAVPGTDALGRGIASLAGAASLNSQFRQDAPSSVLNATHFYNPQISNPRWGGTNFTELGNHVFGNAEQTAAQVASLRANPTPAAPRGPTQVASVNPTMGPPTPQQQTPVKPFSWANLPGAGLVEAGYKLVDDNVIAPTQETIKENGGFRNAGAKARMAVALMNMFSGGGSGGRLGQGGQGNFNTGLKRLASADKPNGKGKDKQKGPKVVDGPTQPMPGFTWVQWSPGSPPSQIPTTALIGVA